MVTVCTAKAGHARASWPSEYNQDELGVGKSHFWNNWTYVVVIGKKLQTQQELQWDKWTKVSSDMTNRTTNEKLASVSGKRTIFLK